MASITITDTIKDADGTFPQSATLSFVLSGIMTTAGGTIIVPSAAETAAVSGVNGTFTVALESTTDATPSNRVYTVSLSGTLDGSPISVVLGSFSLPPAPSSQDLSDLLNAGLIAGGGGVPTVSTLTINSTSPRVFSIESDQTTDEKNWDIIINGKVFQVRTRNDADSSGVAALSVTRGAGTALTSVSVGDSATSLFLAAGGSTRATVNATDLTSTVPVSVSNVTNKTGLLYAGNDALSNAVLDTAVASTVSSAITLRKSRGTQSSRADVSNGDMTAVFAGQAFSGATGYWAGAEMRFLVDGTFTTNQRPPSRIELYTNAANGAQTKYFELDGKGNVVLNGQQTALSTSATDGFSYLPTCAGTPTGTPTSKTGAVPLVVDTTNNRVFFYNSGWKANVTNQTASSPSNPTGTTSTTANGVMMGLAGAITPRYSGVVHITVTGMANNNTIGDGCSVQLRTGTGTAPTNGAAATGTTAGVFKNFVAATAAGKHGFSLCFTVTGLALGTAIWIDCAVKAVTGGTATISDIDIVAVEL